MNKKLMKIKFLQLIQWKDFNKINTYTTKMMIFQTCFKIQNNLELTKIISGSVPIFNILPTILHTEI